MIKRIFLKSLSGIYKKVSDILQKAKQKQSAFSFYEKAIVGEDVVIRASATCNNLSKKKENLIIGSHALIQGAIHVDENAKIKIGDYFYIGQSSLVGAAESITIGDCVIISNDVHIYDNNTHPTQPKSRERMSKEGFGTDKWSWAWPERAPVVIEDNVWIGQYATILKGVTIGKGAIVGTRAVVTKDVPPYAVVAGNPAKVVKYLDPEEDVFKE